MGTVRVKLSKQAEDFHFLARNEAGHSVHIDDATAYDHGTGSGVGPMQMLAMALGGCSGVDVMMILKKSRCDVRRFEISVTGEKPDGVSPSVSHELRVVYDIEGDVSQSRVERAIRLSLGKYCSVAATLGGNARIRFDLVVNGEDFEGAWVEPADPASAS
jgi:putative redox protein